MMTSKSALGVNRGKKVRAHCRDPVLKPVGTRVFGRRKRSIRVYVDGCDTGGAGPGCGKSRIPDPVPTSATRLPVRSSCPMNDAKNSLVMK